MNFKIVMSCKNKKNFVWYKFCNCSKNFKIINFILLIKFFDYSTYFEQLFWQSFLLVYSFFIKTSMIRENIWLFDLNSNFILNKKLIFILHHNFSLSLINRFHHFFVKFELMFKLWHDKNSQSVICIVIYMHDNQSSAFFNIL